MTPILQIQKHPMTTFSGRFGYEFGLTFLFAIDSISSSDLSIDYRHLLQIHCC